MREVEDIIRESIAVKQAIIGNPQLVRTIEAVGGALVDAFKGQKKALFCGNGGSAADAQHVAAELSGRFYFDRAPLYAEALHGNSSHVTAVANDYGYEEVFARSVVAAGRPGDLLVSFTTSGNSPNVLKAVQAANEIGMVTVGLTGETGGKLKGLCHHLLNVPSRDTARIQESHIMIGHILCEIVEESLFGARRG